jgi:hypothetical protein
METVAIGVSGKGPAEATEVDGDTPAGGETGVTNGYTSGGRGRGIADSAEGRTGMLTPGVPGKHTRTLRRLTQRLQQGADANASVL